MTIDYHRTPMIQFRPDAELYAAIEAHQRPGESINQTAKRLLIEAILTPEQRQGRADAEDDEKMRMQRLYQIFLANADRVQEPEYRAALRAWALSGGKGKPPR